MQNVIEKELEKNEFKSEEDLSIFINRIRHLISEYEQDLYDKGTYTRQNQLLVKTWRSKLYNLFQKRDSFVAQSDIPDVLESTVNILNRQIKKIDSNTALLNKGTVKLMGLEYTNTDIDKELVQTRNKIIEAKNIEKREVYLMYFAFYIFLGVCLTLLLDKFLFRF